MAEQPFSIGYIMTTEWSEIVLNIKPGRAKVQVTGHK